MADVTVEVHKGIAEIIKLNPNIEVELVDLDVGSVVLFKRKGKCIDWEVVSEEANHERRNL